jgi:DNA polymerase V
MNAVCLLDCNNFFVSCERLFRPDLKGKPVLVLSSNDGCVVARSEEVKEMGISMGIPYFQIEKLCKERNVAVFSSNFALYRDISRRVMEILRERTETLEIYSIDEAFFEYPAYPSQEEIQDLREYIVRTTGIPVSVGVSKSKTLAKIASRDAKKGSGTSFLVPEDLMRYHGGDLVGTVWGIGRNAVIRLREHQIASISDLVHAEDRLLRQAMGIFGSRIKHELLGVSTHGPVSTEIPASMTSTRSFGKIQTTKNGVMSALAYHASLLAERLRAQNLTTQRVSIFAAPSRYGDFSQSGFSGQVVIPPTSSTQVLLREIGILLERLFVPSIPYGRSGVVVSGLMPTGNTTHSLFEEALDTHDSSEMDHVIDQINGRFGRSMLRYGIVQDSTSWSAKHAKRSGGYTTQWSEIPKVHTR